MKEHHITLLGKHKISYDFARSLAIDCHALDKTAYPLFFDTTYIPKSPRTIEIYNEKVSTSLLRLAISLRTLIYQDPETKEMFPDISFSGIYNIGNRNDRADFDIKDVCDKIIHAEDISRVFQGKVTEVKMGGILSGFDYEKIEFPDKDPVTFISGKYKKSPWMLWISLSSFCEGVLRWIDELEKRDI